MLREVTPKRGNAMRAPRPVIVTAAGFALGLVLAVDSASALSCRPWLRLNAAQREATIVGMIDDALQSNRSRQYEINRAAVARCLLENASNMAIDFDGVCSDSRTADMQAINRVFKTYVWSCAG
jgi:hypothetical protein